MKQTRIRYLLIVFAALFLVNSTMAAARACVAGLAATEHTTTRVVSDCDGPPCAEAATAVHYLVDCTHCYKSDEQSVFLDTPALAIAPPLPLHRVWFLPEPRQPVIASVAPVVGPPLTILFGNLRI